MQKIRIIFAIIGIVILVGLYFAVSPPIQQQGKGGLEEFELEIKNRKLTLSPPIIKLVQGDEVTFRIRADEGGEFHIHTYDEEIGVELGKISTIRFNATLVGRYDIEWHLPKQPGQEEGEHIVIGAIEVSPIG
ncbi:MAG: hypothetical protein HYY67_07800 [Thaumarchaeota archaeon]|nr:hypothetical protein [Nitrososphaerota archaeon]